MTVKRWIPPKTPFLIFVGEWSAMEREVLETAKRVMDAATQHSMFHAAIAIAPGRADGNPSCCHRSEKEGKAGVQCIIVCRDSSVPQLVHQYGHESTHAFFKGEYTGEEDERKRNHYTHWFEEVLCGVGSWLAMYHYGQTRYAHKNEAVVNTLDAARRKAKEEAKEIARVGIDAWFDANRETIQGDKEGHSPLERVIVERIFSHFLLNKKLMAAFRSWRKASEGCQTVYEAFGKLELSGNEDEGVVKALAEIREMFKGSGDGDGT